MLSIKLKIANFHFNQKSQDEFVLFPLFPVSGLPLSTNNDQLSTNPPSSTSLMALALSRHSSYSLSGTDLAVMALPTEKETYFFWALYRMLRITTLKSKLPFGSK